MRDGLSREFPEVLSLARRLPSPRVARTPLLWSALAAFGAAFFVSALCTVVFSLLYRFLAVPSDAWLPRPFELATIASLGTGIAIAHVAGGRKALALYAAVILFERLVSLWGLGRFCGAITPAPPSCSFFGYVLSLWPLALGVALGYGMAHWLRTSDGSGNPILEVAGALAVVQTLVFTGFSLLFIQATPFEAGLLAVAAALASGVACGVALLRRVGASRRWPVLALIALGVLAPWGAVSVPGFLEEIGVGRGIAIGGINLLGFVTPLLQVGAAVLVLYLAAARKVSAEA